MKDEFAMHYRGRSFAIKLIFKVGGCSSCLRDIGTEKKHLISNLLCHSITVADPWLQSTYPLIVHVR